MRSVEIAICGDDPVLAAVGQYLVPDGRVSQLEKLDYSSQHELYMLCPDFIILENKDILPDILNDYWLTHPLSTFVGVNQDNQSINLYLAGKPVPVRIELKIVEQRTDI
jgi:hypothetical protein